jgi:hypothetical protein
MTNEKVSPYSTNMNFNSSPNANPNSRNNKDKVEKLSSNKSRSRSKSRENFASFSKNSRSKIEALKENLDMSLNSESQERKFRMKVDSVKNRLQHGQDEKNKNTYTSLFPSRQNDLRVNLSNLNSLSNNNNQRRDHSPVEEDLSDIILPDEIISELQEKYFGKMEFIDKKKLVKFYKKYINKDSSKSHKLPSFDSLENRKLNNCFLMKQEEADNQKNLRKLREILNLKEETNNNLYAYKANRSTNTELVKFSVYDVNQAKKKLSAVKESIFGIMPTNAIEPNSLKFRSHFAKN